MENFVFANNAPRSQCVSAGTKYSNLPDMTGQPTTFLTLSNFIWSPQIYVDGTLNGSCVGGFFLVSVFVTASLALPAALPRAHATLLRTGLQLSFTRRRIGQRNIRDVGKLRIGWRRL